ncbi:sugar phosphate isomerase/epimerase family protein [Paenibacillus sp. 23TSA30-6]|uniref:sugar phosphate isomerase/epimerase family protein n=1 Tax=Paenibacillus sp. 23TSA30-6 TaxID=2546104 RepID=UPI001787BF1E|nr:sugar phosphate isomerase/epimerase family protein [Paenibacillus sp. 23TSA30-6]MBE0338884.1 sugar phosphate isomerase/epimerase [Paenibacillus sp. 23TSA30-6]
MNANLGIRAHDIENVPLQEAVNIISSKGLTSVQLAVSKSLNDINTKLGSFSPGIAHYISSIFRKKDVQIAVLGCYINMIHPDPSQRRKELDRFKEHIRFARDFGCSIVGTESGNVNPEIVYTEENFSEKPFLDVVENVRELVAEAEKFGVIVGIEGGINHPIHTPERMRRLLDSVPSNNLQVIFDPANFISLNNYQNQESVFQEAFDLFGDRIVIMHAKDLIIEDNGIKFVPVGKGILNYNFLLKLLKDKKPYINILLEETKEQDIDKSVAYINGLYASFHVD